MFPIARRAAWMILVIGVILTGCSDDSTEPKNTPPSAPEMSPSGFTMVPEGLVLLTASATDPDGDALAYEWSFEDGSPTSANGAQVTWTAPDCECDVDIDVTVSDGNGGATSNTFTVSVHPNAAYPYAVPAEGTMEPDLSQLAEGAGQMAAPQGLCHTFASAAVLWTNAAVVIFTGLPTIAFLEALTHTPVWYPPATWTWAYTLPGQTTLTTVELSATLVGATDLDWEMLVSGTANNYDRFQWVTGESRTDAGSGHWILFDHLEPAEPAQALRIEYSHQAMDDRDLDYFNVLERSPGVGDSLSYSVHGTTAEVRLHDVSEDKMSAAVWDTEEGSGMFIGANGDSCCWGAAPTFPDVDCP